MRLPVASLDCGVYDRGFARVSCDGCRAEYLVAFSCQRRGLCPSCVAKRGAIFGAVLAEEVLEQVGHCLWTFTIPKMLRPYFLHHRLLGGLCQAGWKVAGLAPHRLDDGRERRRSGGEERPTLDYTPTRPRWVSFRALPAADFLALIEEIKVGFIAQADRSRVAPAPPARRDHPAGLDHRLPCSGSLLDTSARLVTNDQHIARYAVDLLW